MLLMSLESYRVGINKDTSYFVILKFDGPCSAHHSYY